MQYNTKLVVWLYEFPGGKLFFVFCRTCKHPPHTQTHMEWSTNTYNNNTNSSTDNLLNIEFKQNVSICYTQSIIVIIIIVGKAFIHFYSTQEGREAQKSPPKYLFDHVEIV